MPQIPTIPPKRPRSGVTFQFNIYIHAHIKAVYVRIFMLPINIIKVAQLKFMDE